MEGRQQLVKALMNNSLGASVGSGAVDPADLPRRYLSPGIPGIVSILFEFKLNFVCSFFSI